MRGQEVAKKNEDLLFDPATRADRPVLNQKDTPDFINLATHYKDSGRELEKYESLQFTDGSVDFRNRFEDEAIVRGQVQPSAKGPNPVSGSGRPAVTAVPATNGYPPYRDIPGVYATVGEPVKKAQKQVRYVTVASSLAYIYNPVVLVVFIVMLALLIGVEILGIIYVF